MSLHILHPDTIEIGLVDGCQRCAEHAENPFGSLDDEHIRQLATRIRNGLDPRSDNEAIAMNKVKAVLLQSVRLARLGIL